MLPSPRLVIFDLDGTLVDSLRDIGESLNACLTLLGLPTYSIDRYRYMVGEGFPELCRRAIGAEHPLLGRLIELGRARYRPHCLDHTRPYPGVKELIGRLRGTTRLAVLSNKPHDMTARIVTALWPDGVFDRVQGMVTEQHRKPSPHHVHEIGTQLGIATRDTWFVGDTPTDVQPARAAGCHSIGVTWGYRTRDDLIGAGAARIIDHPDEL